MRSWWYVCLAVTVAVAGCGSKKPPKVVYDLLPLVGKRAAEVEAVLGKGTNIESTAPYGPEYTPGEYRDYVIPGVKGATLQVRYRSGIAVQLGALLPLTQAVGTPEELLGMFGVDVSGSRPEFEALIVSRWSGTFRGVYLRRVEAVCDLPQDGIDRLDPHHNRAAQLKDLKKRGRWWSATVSTENLP